MILVSFGGVALDNKLRLELLGSIFIPILCNIEGTSKANRPLVLELITTLDL